MRSETLRTYKTVHTWSGILAALLLFIAFYAGALTMFKAELVGWMRPVPLEVAQSVPLSVAPSLIDRTLALHPAARAQLTVTLNGDRAALSWPDGLGRTQRAWLDDRQQLVTEVDHAADAAAFVDMLHMTAGIPGGYALGAGIMGGVCLLYTLALISGVVVLLPTLIRDLFALRVGKNLKRMWLDAHNAIGILSLPFHLVIAVSVVAFGLGDTIYKIQDGLIYHGKLHTMMASQNPYFAEAPHGSGMPAAPLMPQDIIKRVVSAAPHFVPTSIVYRHVYQPGATAFVSGSDARQLARDGGFVLLDAVSGRFVDAEFLPGFGNAWSSLTSALYALHFGTYGGTTVRVMYLLLGLAGAFLFYSGNLLWIESRRKRMRGGNALPRQRRAAYVMASLSVGTAWGCVVAISSALVLAKALHGASYGPVQSAYYSVFLSCLGWALLRGGARAAVDLSALAAAMTALMPVLDILTRTVWATSSDAGWSQAAVTIDGGATLLALCWIWIWCATVRRVRAGAPDSVWSRPA